jgi:hypothetical protein
VEWLLTFGGEGLEATRAREDADVMVRGTAGTLLLLLWNRLPVDASDLEVVGDARLVDRLVRAAAL